jgi:hypothetical protein
MSKKENNKSWLLLLLIPLFAFGKKKKDNELIVEDPYTTPSPNADFLVQIASGRDLYNMDFQKVGITATVQHWDGYNSNTLPTWVKVKNPLGQTFYVHAGDYKITYRR